MAMETAMKSLAQIVYKVYTDIANSVQVTLCILMQ